MRPVSAEEANGDKVPGPDGYSWESWDRTFVEALTYFFEKWFMLNE